MMTENLTAAFFAVAVAMIWPLSVEAQMVQAVLIFLAILNFDIWVTQMRRRHNSA